MDTNTIDIERVRDDVGELLAVMRDVQTVMNRALEAAGRLDEQIGVLDWRDVGPARDQCDPIADVYTEIEQNTWLVHYMFSKWTRKEFEFKYQMLARAQAVLDGPLQSTPEAQRQRQARANTAFLALRCRRRERLNAGDDKPQRYRPSKAAIAATIGKNRRRARAGDDKRRRVA